LDLQTLKEFEGWFAVTKMYLSFTDVQDKERLIWYSKEDFMAGTSNGVPYWRR